MAVHRIVVISTLLIVTLVTHRIPAAAALAPSKASQIVTLVNGGSSCPAVGMAIDQRLLPDGTVQPFTIPPKQVLVITEVDWGAAAAQASKATGVVLSAQAPSATGAIGFFLDVAIADSVGIAGRTAIVASAVVRSGTSLCVTPAGAGGGTLSVIVRGFLTKDR